MSLVRSNTRGKIGFLKEKNRLVVGTSRQKRGLYIIGDVDFLKLNSQIVWKVSIFVVVLIETEMIQLCRNSLRGLMRNPLVKPFLLSVRWSSTRVSTLMSLKLQQQIQIH